MASCKENQDKPGSPWDVALLVAAMVASVPFIAANIVVLRHRKRSFFRAHGGAPLILTSSIAGLIWIGAAFVINHHFPRNHHFLLNCPLWSFWLYFTFGYWLWLACQLARLLHLHYLCQNTTSASSAKRWTLLWFLLFWIPGLVVTIVAGAVHASFPKGRIGDVCADCHVRPRWAICMYVIVPSIYAAILAILLICFKSTKDYMMAIERSHTCEYSFIMAVVIHLLYGAVILTHSKRKIPGRCFLTFCICYVVFINFWVRLGWPVYLCVCKSEAEIDSFEEDLQGCGAHCLDKLSSGASRVMARSFSSLHDGDWILRAIDAAMSEAAECKERINQLEQRKADLSAKIERLGVSAHRRFRSSSASARG